MESISKAACGVQQWIQDYEDVEKFVNQYNCLPTQKTDSRLYEWLKITYNRVINSNKKKQLSPLERKILNMIKGWEASIPDVDEEWTSHYDLLKQFVLENSRLPLQSEKSEKDIYKWAEKQKYNKKTCKKQDNKRVFNVHWNDTKEKMLSQIPGWFWSKYSDEFWSQMLVKLLAYIDEHSKMPSAKDKFENCIQLTKWCQQQRKYFKEKSLSEDKIKQLEQVPKWQWELKKNEQWATKVALLEKYLSENGKYPEAFSSTDSAKQLYKWMILQKKKYRQVDPTNHNDKPKHDMLSKLPQWTWNVETDEFYDEMITNVTNMMQQQGNIKLSKSQQPFEKKCVQWARSTLAKYKEQKLTESQKEKFEPIATFMLQYAKQPVQ